MIETAAIVWAGTATFMGVWAGLGWMVYARKLAIALDDAAYERWSHDITKKTLASTIAVKIETEDKLRKIERQRSETTRKGNETRARKRREAVLAKAAELQPVERRKAA